MQVKDFTEAQNPAIFSHLNSQNLIPDYVMESDRITSEEADGLSVVAFADPFTRAYPCHTKAACWQSAAWYAGTQQDTPQVKEAIVKMAAAHGITEDVQKVFDCFDAERVKVAHAEAVTEEPQYALSLDFNGYDGRGFEQHYPISSTVDVLNSCEDAAEDFLGGILPMPVMRKVATVLVKAAADHNVEAYDIPKVVARYGVQRLPNPYAAEALVTMRKNASVDITPYLSIMSELKQAMEKAAGYAEAISLADNAAAQLYDLDMNNQIRYNARMEDPYALIFTGPCVADLEKYAAHTVNILDVDVPVVDFMNLSTEKIDAMFSKNAAAAIKKAKEAVSGEPSMEKTASAAATLASLPVEVNKVLLGVLADTTW